MYAKNTHDNQVLAANAQKDPQAFAAIFDAYYSDILRYVVRRTNNVSLAEDITSEVFIKALRGISKFEYQGVPISAWLYKIATNELRMHYRKRHYTTSLDELLELHGFEPLAEVDLAIELEDAQNLLNRQQLYIQAHQCITRLPVKYQEVLVLRFTENKKISEIAQILDKKEGTVKSLVSRGLQLLRKEIKLNGTQPFESECIVYGEGKK
jgi:RNA polymerase sigma-70 factor (ECF subfamily)